MADQGNPVVDANAWTPYCQENPAARLRLFCFHYAGGGASMYRSWPEYLPVDVEIRGVQLPGRENRRQEEPCKDLKPLVGESVTVLESLLDKPFAIFGHSMGALLAFEAAREIRRRHEISPVHLFLSSWPAAQIQISRARVSDLPEEEFLASMTKYRLIPEQLLQHRELISSALGVLRADVALCESYTYRQEDPFECPVSVYGGLEDINVTKGDLMAWQEQSFSPIKLRLFPGGHFYLEGSRERLLSTITASFAQV